MNQIFLILNLFVENQLKWIIFQKLHCCNESLSTVELRSKNDKKTTFFILTKNSQLWGRKKFYSLWKKDFSKSFFQHTGRWLLEFFFQKAVGSWNKRLGTIHQEYGSWQISLHPKQMLQTFYYSGPSILSRTSNLMSKPEHFTWLVSRLKFPTRNSNNYMFGTF